MAEQKTIWIDRYSERDRNLGQYTKTVNGVFLSYQPNEIAGRDIVPLDSENPETAIVIINDKKIGELLVNRYLIFRGDRRKELEPLFPDVQKLKDYWQEHGGHFWSDSLTN